MPDMPDVIYADAPISSLHDGEWRATPDKLATKYIRADAETIEAIHAMEAYCSAQILMPAAREKVNVVRKWLDTIGGNDA